MTALLLSVLTICSPVGGPAHDCIPPRPPLQDMPIITTWYDPALMGIHCDHDCSHLSLAPMSDDLYGFAAACPAELVGVDWTAVIYHPAIGERACLDRGGLVTVDYRYVEGVGWLWCLFVDLLERGPHPSNWQLLSGWEVRWERPGDLD